MKIDKKRRLRNRTDYRKRLILLKSNSPRFVIRKTNRYLILQVIESDDAMDKIIYNVNSKELLKLGWSKEKEGSLKSIPAAYMAGLLLGKKAGKLKTRVVLDIGLSPNTKGSRIYAAVKGIADSGIKINYDESMIPSKERINGKDAKLDEKMLNKIKENITK